jgi:hypothetical protein
LRAPFVDPHRHAVGREVAQGASASRRRERAKEAPHGAVAWTARVRFPPGYAPDLNLDALIRNVVRQRGTSRRPLRRSEHLRHRVASDLAAIKAYRRRVRSFFADESAASTMTCSATHLDGELRPTARISSRHASSLRPRRAAAVAPLASALALHEDRARPESRLSVELHYATAPSPVRESRASPSRNHRRPIRMRLLRNGSRRDPARFGAARALKTPRPWD